MSYAALTSGCWHAFVVMYRRAWPHRSRWTRSTPCSGKTQTTRNHSELSSATRPFGRRGHGAFVVLGCQCNLSPAVVVLVFGPFSLLSSRLSDSYARTSCEDTGGARLGGVAGQVRGGTFQAGAGGRGAGEARGGAPPGLQLAGPKQRAPGAAAVSVQKFSVCGCAVAFFSSRSSPFFCRL